MRSTSAFAVGGGGRLQGRTMSLQRFERWRCLARREHSKDAIVEIDAGGEPECCVSAEAHDGDG